VSLCSLYIHSLTLHRVSMEGRNDQGCAVDIGEFVMSRISRRSNPDAVAAAASSESQHSSHSRRPLVP
jgi:hypothetical protein